MKTLEPILIDTSLRFGQMDIMQWFPETTEEDAQSALVAAQEAADAFFSEKWSDSTWMLDFDVSAAKQDGGWLLTPVFTSEPTYRDLQLFVAGLGVALKNSAWILTNGFYQKPLIDHILREIEETRTRESVEQGRW